MTVQKEIPYESFVADGLDYQFSWTCDSANEVKVDVNGVRQVQNGTYELVDFETDEGGTVRFFEEPTGTVEVYRVTPVTQEVDYTEFTRFPAETHESQMDKDTRILQELIDGFGALGRGVNLTAEQLIDRINILNDSGTDAAILPWECTGQRAGAFLGAVVDTAPADGDPTTRPDGFMWFELEEGAPAPGAGLVWPVSQLDTFQQRSIPAQFIHQTFLNQSGESLVVSSGNANRFEETDWLDAPITGSTQFHIRYTVVAANSSNGTAITNLSNVPEGQWTDAWAAIAQDGYVRLAWLWFTSQPANAVINFDVEIAPDDGTGSPDEALKITRKITYSYEATP